jgi:hypothetical protein
MFEEDKIYISRTDGKGRIWIWKSNRRGEQQYFFHRLLIDVDGTLDYEESINENHHGWSDNILAIDDEANWLEQCILDPNLHNKNIKDIPLLKKEINYEIY